MSVSIIAPYEITLASGLEFYPSAGSPIATRLAPTAIVSIDDFQTDPTSRWTVQAGTFGWDSGVRYTKTNISQSWSTATYNTLMITGDELIEAKVTMQAGAADHSVVGILSRNAGAATEGYLFGLWKDSAGVRKARIDYYGLVTIISVAYNWIDNQQYLLGLSCANGYIKGYIDNVEILSIYDITFSSANKYTGVVGWGPISYFDDFTIKTYPTNSPAATHKFSIPGNSIQDIAECLDLMENSLGGTGSLSYGYQLNGGSLVSGQTLAQLKAAIRNATITVHTDSLIVYVSHVSNGAQQAESAYGRTNAIGGGLHVEDPTGSFISTLID